MTAPTEPTPPTTPLPDVPTVRLVDPVPIGNIGPEALRKLRQRVGAATCGYCGKDEQDGVGVIVMGACDDCRRVWA